MKTIREMSTEELKKILETTSKSDPFEEFHEAAWVSINQEILRRETDK